MEHKMRQFEFQYACYFAITVIAIISIQGCKDKSTDPSSDPSISIQDSCNYWIKKASAPRKGILVGTATNGKIFIASDSGIGIFNPNLNQWTNTSSSRPTTQWLLDYISSEDKIYALGGYGAINSDTIKYTMDEFDLISNTWAKRDSLPNVIPLCCAILNNIIYLVGWEGNSSTSFSPFYAYNLTTNKWIMKNSLPKGFGSEYTCLVYKNEIIVITRTYKYRYNPTTDTWSDLNINFGERYASYCILGDIIYEIGGEGVFATSNRLYAINLITGETRGMVPMSTTREFVLCLALNNKIYALGGYTYYRSDNQGNYVSSYLDLVEEYTPCKQ